MPIRISPAIHESNVEHHYARDPATQARREDAVLDALSSALARAREAAGQMAAAHEAILADRTATEAARAVRARRAVSGRATKIAESMDAVRRRVVAEIEAVKASMAVLPPASAAEAEIAREIRGRFVKRNRQERADIIGSAIRTGNERVVGAILGADLLLTDLTEAEHAARLDQWQKVRHPDARDRLDRLARALDALDRGGAAFVGLARDLTSSPTALLAEQAATRAAEAEAAA